MCTGAEIGLILTAVGGGASTINNANALSRKDRQTAAGIRKNSAEQDDANRLVNDQIRSLAEGDARDESADALSEFQSALRGNRGATEGSLSGVPGASDRFAESVSGARAGVATKGNEQAQRLSIIDGILRQRIGEGTEIGRTGGDLNAVKSNIGANDFLTQLRVAGERPSTAVDLLAGLAQGVGSGMALRVPGTPIDPAVLAPPKQFVPNPFSGLGGGK